MITSRWGLFFNYQPTMSCRYINVEDLKDNRNKACPECPFSKRCAPGALGGSDPAVYIGQINGPFWLPCHLHKGYKDKETKPEDVCQCAGAAIFRANLNISFPKLPLLQLPPDNGEDVFKDYAEFLMHHMNISRFIAEQLLQVLPPDVLTAKEYADKDLKHMQIRSKDQNKDE